MQCMQIAELNGQTNPKYDGIDNTFYWQSTNDWLNGWEFRFGIEINLNFN